MARPILIPELLDVLGGKHAFTILALVMEGSPCRFNALRVKYRVSAKTLSAILRRLAVVGFVEKLENGAYQITPRGAKVVKALAALVGSI